MGVAVGLDGLLELVEGGFEFLDFSELQGEGHGIAGCPEAEGWVGALHNFCEDGETAWQKGLGLLTGEIGGLLAVVGQLLAKLGFLEPAVEGGLADARVAGGLGDGGSHGDGREGGLLAKGEGRNLEIRVICSHFRPFGVIEVFLVGDGEGEAGRVGAGGSLTMAVSDLALTLSPNFALIIWKQVSTLLRRW